MRTRTGYTNDSDFIDKGFLKHNLAVGIPYLIIVTGATVYGCVGNVMVIGAVTMYKVGLIEPPQGVKRPLPTLFLLSNTCKRSILQYQIYCTVRQTA